MHILPERIDQDRSRKERVRDAIRKDGRDALDVWVPQRSVSVGPRDRSAAGFSDAVAIGHELGFPIVERRLGGRPVALNPSTLAFFWASPATATGVRDRYQSVQSTVSLALDTVGVETEVGEPTDSFCPGSYGLSADGKLAGFAQRVHAEVAIVGGVVIIDGADELATVLDAVYGALDLPFDPSSVGSVVLSGGDTDPKRVREHLIDAFLDQTI